jgi:hypothetical protein
VLTRVVSEKSLLVLPGEITLRVGAGIGSTVRKYFINPILEMFHHKMILLLPVLVLRLGLEPAELTRMGGSEPIRVLR